jgi:hypothetical protein
MNFKLRPDPETRWRWAITAWADGDTAGVLRLLAVDTPIPGFARAWLADAVLGKVKRRRGPKKARPDLARAVREVEIRANFDLALAAARYLAAEDAEAGRVGDTPTTRAIASLARKHGLSEDAVSRIVFHRKARNSRK